MKPTNKCLMVFASILLAFGVLSCNGGGGGDGSTTPSSYEGETSQAVIHANNAVSLVTNAWDMGTAGLDLTELPSESDTSSSATIAGSIQPHVLAEKTIQGDCGGFAHIVIDTIDLDDGDFSGRIVFYDDYCVEDVIWEGTTPFSGSIDTETGEVEVLRLTLTDLTFSVASASYAFTEGSASISIHSDDQGETLRLDAVLRDNNMQKTYWMDDYVVNVSYATNDQLALSGRFYDHDYGYVDFVTESALIISDEDGIVSGVLLFTGFGSKAKLIFRQNQETELQVDADNDGSYEQIFENPL